MATKYLGTGFQDATTPFSKYKGAWSSSTAYLPGDLVVSGSLLWSALSLNTNVTPSATTVYNNVGAQTVTATSANATVAQPFTASANITVTRITFATAVTATFTANIGIAVGTPSSTTPTWVGSPAVFSLTGGIAGTYNVDLPAAINLNSGSSYSVVIQTTSGTASYLITNPGGSPTFTGSITSSTPAKYGSDFSSSSTFYLGFTLYNGVLPWSQVSVADSSATHFKGVWAAGSYSVGDLVTYNNALYVCNTAISAAGATFVASRAVVGGASQSSATNATLPTGTQAGDFLLVGIAGRNTTGANPTSIVVPSGATLLAGHVNPNNTYYYMGVYGYTVQASDISSGYVVIPAQTTFDGAPGAVLHTFRNAAYGNVSSAVYTSATGPSITPSGNGFAYTLVGIYNYSSNETVSQSNLLSFINSGGIVVAAAGYETATAGVATTQRVFTDTAGSMAGSTSHILVLSIVAAGSFPAAYFTQLSTVVANQEQVTTISATVSQTASATEYNRINAASAEVDVTPPQTTTAGLRYTYKKIDSSSNVGKLIGTFDGATNYTLATQYKYVTIMTTTTAGTFEVVANN